jgi:hypothetical protein
MVLGRLVVDELLRGDRVKDGLPLSLAAYLGDLRSRFLYKGRAGRGHRYVARNGRVLLVTERVLGEWVDCLAHVRLQIWHRAILPGDRPEAYGVVMRLGEMSAGSPLPGGRGSAVSQARLVKPHDGAVDLAVDVGGRLVLEFQPSDT